MPFVLEIVLWQGLRTRLSIHFGKLPFGGTFIEEDACLGGEGGFSREA